MVLGTVLGAAQIALQLFQTLDLTGWPTCNIKNGTYYDFIIVGGGTAGCVLANRLSANSSYTVLLIEAGGHTPVASNVPGLVSTLHRSQYDYQMNAVNDHRTAQKVDGKVTQLTGGKMLSGSSGLNLMLHVHGDPYDFNNWALRLSDKSWNYTNIQKYMKRQETLTDPELRSSGDDSLHGRDGPVHVRRYTRAANAGILAAAQELGIKYVKDTTSTTSTLGITEPLTNIDKGLRQSSSVTYLKEAKSRPNLCVLVYTTATKILIKDNVAIGVQFVDADGKVYNIYSRKEVVVSAGSLHSPQLLMLSGIGPKSHLESLDIDVVVDSPVGQNLQDHPQISFAYQLDTDLLPDPIPDLFEFPLPATSLFAALNSTQKHPDYQALIIVFSHDSASLLLLCKDVFKYSSDVCTKWFLASIGKTLLLVVLNLQHPKSCGELHLASADHRDSPITHTGTYTDPGGEDLETMIKSLVHFNRMKTTSYFKKSKAKLVDLGLGADGADEEEYWSSYAEPMTSTMWHYIGTCSMGTVLDSSLRVRGVARLRVVDASAMPAQISGNIRAAVNMVAERGASLILSDWGISTTFS